HDCPEWKHVLQILSVWAGILARGTRSLPTCSSKQRTGGGAPRVSAGPPPYGRGDGSGLQGTPVNPAPPYSPCPALGA
ncbi:unnamed protein product, partial [Rangifer tarandus platyrhynchus]